MTEATSMVETTEEKFKSNWHRGSGYFLMDGLEFMDTSQNSIALGFRKQNLYQTLLSANFKSKYKMASSIEVKNKLTCKKEASNSNATPF